MARVTSRKQKRIVNASTMYSLDHDTNHLVLLWKKDKVLFQILVRKSFMSCSVQV